MSFLEYQSICPFCKFGIKDDCLSEFELTCRRKDNIPHGWSWGICDEKHCPEFGVEINMRDIVARDAVTGKVIFTAESGKCRAVEKVEDDICKTMNYILAETIMNVND